MNKTLRFAGTLHLGLKGHMNQNLIAIRNMTNRDWMRHLDATGVEFMDTGSREGNNRLNTSSGSMRLSRAVLNRCSLSHFKCYFEIDLQ